jgi:hypothetical protein
MMVTALVWVVDAVLLILGEKTTRRMSFFL